MIALLGAVRRWRDRAMLEAMVLGGLRCCEVVGLRLEDLHPTERRVFIADGKGGHQRLVPDVARSSSRASSTYLSAERPADATSDQLFVVLKGARRGEPLSIDGLEQIVRGAKTRAGLAHATCHQLRHTCLTRLREAGMALGSDPGPSRASFDRIDPRVSASRGRLARGRVSPCRRADRRDRRDPPMTAAGRAHRRWAGPSSRLGGRRRARTAARGDRLALPGPDRLVVSACDRRRRRQHAAVASPAISSPPTRMWSGSSTCAAPMSKRSRLFFAAQPTVKGVAAGTQHDPATARDAAQLLRSDHRMGLARRAAPHPDLRGRCPRRR